VGKLLYVGNMTSSVSSAELQEWFTPFGTVQCAQVIQDRDTGDSKGFGFVEMDTDAQAQSAIQSLNDCEHEGRWLIVCEAKSRKDRFGYGAVVSNDRPPSRRVWRVTLAALRSLRFPN
jgi:RNA recognition motif-containing protein